MDPNGRIYMDDEDKIPAEDKARLDGYLRGRAEADELMRDVKAAAREAKIRELMEQERGVLDRLKEGGD